MMIAPVNELRAFCDPSYAGYLGDVTSNAEGISRVINGWADALAACVAAIVPVSVSGPAAKSAFIAAATPLNCAPGWQVPSCAAFASALAAGMLPLYTGTPPASSFIPASSSLIHQVACIEMANELLAWFQTGTATLVAPPFTTQAWA